MNLGHLFTLHHALLVAGAMHFFILIASAMVPKVLDWKTELAKLTPFLRTLFWVYGVFIVLTIVSFGTLTLLHADAMARGETVARSVAAVMAVFWGARLVVQCFVFEARPVLTKAWMKLGYHALTVAFVFLAAAYTWAAIAPAY
jgi:hypothetical protein